MLSSADTVRRLQTTAGNRAVGRLLARKPYEAGLATSDSVVQPPVSWVKYPPNPMAMTRVEVFDALQLLDDWLSHDHAHFAGRAEGAARAPAGLRASAHHRVRVPDLPALREPPAVQAARGLRARDPPHRREPSRARPHQPRRARRSGPGPLPGRHVGGRGPDVARGAPARGGPARAALLDAAVVPAGQLREVGEGRREAPRARARHLARARVAVDRPARRRPGPRRDREARHRRARDDVRERPARGRRRDPEGLQGSRAAQLEGADRHEPREGLGRSVQAVVRAGRARVERARSLRPPAQAQARRRPVRERLLLGRAVPQVGSPPHRPQGEAARSSRRRRCPPCSSTGRRSSRCRRRSPTAHAASLRSRCGAPRAS